MIKEYKRLPKQNLEEIYSLLNSCDPKEYEVLDFPSLKDANFFVLHYEEHTLNSVAMTFEYEDTIDLFIITHKNYRRNGISSSLLEKIKAHYKNDNRPFIIMITSYMLEKMSWLKNRKDISVYETNYLMKLPACSNHTPCKKRILLNLSDNPGCWANLHGACFRCDSTVSEEYYEDGDSYILKTVFDGGLYDKTSKKVKDGRYHRFLGVVTLSPQRNQTLFLSGFGILPRFQNKGYAKEALNAIREKFKGYDIILHVTSRNEKAFRLYKNAGFYVTQEQTTYMLKK